MQSPAPASDSAPNSSSNPNIAVGGKRKTVAGEPEPGPKRARCPATAHDAVAAASAAASAASQSRPAAFALTAAAAAASASAASQAPPAAFAVPAAAAASASASASAAASAASEGRPAAAVGVVATGVGANAVVAAAAAAAASSAVAVAAAAAAASTGVADGSGASALRRLGWPTDRSAVRRLQFGFHVRGPEWHPHTWTYDALNILRADGARVLQLCDRRLLASFLADAPLTKWSFHYDYCGRVVRLMFQKLREDGADIGLLLAPNINLPPNLPLQDATSTAANNITTQDDASAQYDHEGIGPGRSPVRHDDSDLDQDQDCRNDTDREDDAGTGHEDDSGDNRESDSDEGQEDGAGARAACGRVGDIDNFDEDAEENETAAALREHQPPLGVSLVYDPFAAGGPVTPSGLPVTNGVRGQILGSFRDYEKRKDELWAPVRVLLQNPPVAMCSGVTKIIGEYCDRFLPFFPSV